MTVMTDAAPQAAAKPHLPDAQIVTQVKHWTDRLFSFRVPRPKSLRFRSGEFVMIGLLGDTGKPLLRSYSSAPPALVGGLEFYSRLLCTTVERHAHDAGGAGAGADLGAGRGAGHAVARGMGQGRAGGIADRAGRMAVSYTHLDVYKRQAPLWLRG